MATWKTFSFFNVSEVKPAADPESASAFESHETSAISSGSDSLFLGSADGVVRVVTKAFKVVRLFKAHDSGAITHLKQVEGTSLLITVAEDLSSEPVLKVWALDKNEKDGSPKCQSTLTIHNGHKQFPISAFSALENLSQIAVGFANGAVTLIRGDLMHDLPPKQRTVFESPEPITGIEFLKESSVTTLYLGTTARILTLVVSGKGQGQQAHVLEDRGCDVGCMTADPNSGEIVVVREDGINYYTQHGRGQYFPITGQKTSITVFKDYAGIVSPAHSMSASFTQLAGQADDLLYASTLTLFDTDLKHIAQSQPFVSEIRKMFSNWGDFYVLTMDGKVHRFQEKSLSEKLQILYQRYMFKSAIAMAGKAKLEKPKQNIIFQKYGDYLYSKGEHDGAMEQYLKAIDSIEPSQVIRKFLDTQQIHNLIEFLEELHNHNKATADHTTLLLNCYAKLKDVDKLEKFIKSPGDLKFDPDTAIQMCRQGGYFEQATYLAEKHGEGDLVIEIMIDDSKKYEEALAYMRTLEPNSAYRNLMKYSRLLLEHCSDTTTAFFIQYYTGKYQPVLKTQPAGQPSSPNGTPGAIQNLAALLPLPFVGTSVATPSTDAGQPKQFAPPSTSDAALAVVPDYSPPKPRTAFSCFVDNPAELITFLEACLAEGSNDEEDKIDLYTTLLEMYLHNSREKKGSEKDTWESKAKKLIDNRQVTIDTSNVLLLSHLSNFKEGTTLVREKEGLYFDIFRSFTSASDTDGVIRTVKKYGRVEPQLYPAALAYFTSSATILEEAGDELNEVLKKIDEDGLMAPLQVIQVLSTNAVATMGMIKAYLTKTIEREKKEITNNRRHIERYRTETQTIRKDIETLKNTATVSKSTRCATCGAPLDLPTVHFLCGHSFHERCLNQVNDDLECPIDAPMNAQLRAIKRGQDEAADRQDSFKDALQRSNDRFKTVSEFFGRGVMSVPTID